MFFMLCRIILRFFFDCICLFNFRESYVSGNVSRISILIMMNYWYSLRIFLKKLWFFTSILQGLFAFDFRARCLSIACRLTGLFILIYLIQNLILIHFFIIVFLHNIFLILNQYLLALLIFCFNIWHLQIGINFQMNMLFIILFHLFTCNFFIMFMN